jgi:ATP-binding cassette subfamily B protein
MAPGVREAAHSLPAPRAITGGIRFERVTFGYAGSDTPLLRNVDLLIPAGQIAAVVGPNGAGKSTLLKLLCRFYDPLDGRISIDGTDIREFAVSDLRRAISVLFQMPVHYTATARENIAFGDRAANPNDAQIEAAARAAGAHEVVMRLPRGYDTLLGRVFQSGAELSSGEWQRLALARAFLRSSPILALDEPTSFMDSWAETDWLERFTALARNRTALLITHRFTTAMRAHVIYVMQDGEVAESGTHDQLLAAGGLYATSWHAQMRSSTPVRAEG